MRLFWKSVRRLDELSPVQWLLVTAGIAFALLAFLHGVLDPLRASGVL